MTRPQPRSTLFPYTTLFRSAATATKSSEIQISVLRVRSVKLASNDGSATYSRVGAGPSHRIRDRLLNRYWLADRKSTRLNSSHQIISYAVFCLKKKT